MTVVRAETYEEARDAAIAQSTLNPQLRPVIAVKGIHRFLYEADEFPLGHPLPSGYEIAARYQSKGRWERYDESQD